MGINWIRMRPKRNANEDELTALTALQAKSFQSLPGSWSTDQIEPYDLYDKKTAHRLEQQYLDASRALKEMLEFPQEDDATDTALDYPDLAVCRRVYPITRNSIFPLRWRMEAHRTFVPQSLEHQIGVWKEWLSAVVNGQHEAFLLNQYLYETTISLNAMYPDLRRAAQKSLSESGRCATEPDISAVRDRILAFEVPAIHPAPVLSTLRSDAAAQPPNYQAFQAVTDKVAEIIALTRAWDSKKEHDQRLCYFENYETYYITFEQFLDRAKDEALHDFLKWAEACCSKEMGLFLDW